MPEPVVYLAMEMDDIASFDFACGRACIFTRRSPGKATPNEDAIALAPCGDHAGALIVADGLGGLPAGDAASGQVVNSLVESVNNCRGNSDSMRDAILNGVEQANEKIVAMNIGAATTVAVVEIQPREARPYHVGDSMTLITGQRGKIKYLTVPHSPVGYAVEAGLLDADDAMYHDERHLLSNAVGTAHMHVEVGPRITLAARDTLLVASDGLFDNLMMDEIVDTVRKGPLEIAATSLARRCHTRMTLPETGQPHKPDDLSFILYRPG